MTPLDWARAYVQRGWQPVPIPSGEKGPKLPGWGKLRLALDDLPHHFGNNCNVGIILGPPSGELVDIDLDCPEAIELADLYVPPTGAEFGRKSKPRSHRLYIAPGAVHEAFADPLDGTTLLELRAAGCTQVAKRSNGQPASSRRQLSKQPRYVPWPPIWQWAA
jgi:hypothetical protein